MLDVLCLPQAGWTLNSFVVAQLKPEIIEIQQARTKEVHPLTPTQRPFKTTPEHNQYMDEFPVSLLSFGSELAPRSCGKGS